VRRLKSKELLALDLVSKQSAFLKRDRVSPSPQGREQGEGEGNVR